MYYVPGTPRNPPGVGHEPEKWNIMYEDPDPADEATASRRFKEAQEERMADDPHLQ